VSEFVLTSEREARRTKNQNGRNRSSREIGGRGFFVSTLEQMEMFMQEFAFESHGIRVEFQGRKLFLTPSMLADFEDRYVGRVSERTLQAMLTVSQNVAAIGAHAEREGRKAVFGTTTFMYDNDYMQRMGWSKALVAELRKYRTELRRLTGLECVWVLERNGVNRRLHEQEVWSGFLPLELVERAKQKGSGIGRCNVKEGFDPFYLNKEMGKSVGCRGNGIRHFGAMGPFEGKSQLRDFVLDSPMAECRRIAWAMRDNSPGHWQHYSTTWRQAREIWQDWFAGRLDLGGQYDRYREAMAALHREKADNGQVGDRGDACEGKGGDTDFNVEDFER
jgi:hypothetical protein